MFHPDFDSSPLRPVALPGASRAGASPGSSSTTVPASLSPDPSSSPGATVEAWSTGVSRVSLRALQASRKNGPPKSSGCMKSSKKVSTSLRFSPRSTRKPAILRASNSLRTVSWNRRLFAFTGRRTPFR